LTFPARAAHGIKCRVTFARPEQPPRARFAFRGAWDGLTPAKAGGSPSAPRKIQPMGFADPVLGLAEGKTRGLNPSYKVVAKDVISFTRACRLL
jgi:hypothetical protein